jgi:hypothetical protein
MPGKTYLMRKQTSNNSIFRLGWERKPVRRSRDWQICLHFPPLLFRGLSGVYTFLILALYVDIYTPLILYGPGNLVSANPSSKIVVSPVLQGAWSSSIVRGIFRNAGWVKHQGHLCGGARWSGSIAKIPYLHRPGWRAKRGKYQGVGRRGGRKRLYTTTHRSAKRPNTPS